MNEDVLNNINGILDDLESYLEDTTNISPVWNRPFFPPLIMGSKAVSLGNWAIINKKIKQMWPQFERQILELNYQPDASEIVFFDSNVGTSVKENAINIESHINNILKNRGVYANPAKWVVYNIIDTSSCMKTDEFIDHYNAITYLESVFGKELYTVLLLLLHDERASGEDEAEHIRSFLANIEQQDNSSSNYDSIIVISDRSLNGEVYDFSELYKIVGSIVVTLNNNSGKHSVESPAIAQVSNMGILTTSYLYKSKPNRRIVEYLFDGLIKRLVKGLKTRHKDDKTLIKAIQEITFQFTDAASSRALSDANRIINYMPTICMINEDLAQMRIDAYRNEIAPDRDQLIEIAVKMVNDQVGNIDDLMFFEEYEKALNDNVEISYWLSKGDTEIAIDWNRSKDRNSCSVLDFYRDSVLAETGEKFMNQYLPKAISSLTEKAKDISNCIIDIYDQTKKIIFPESDDAFRSMYGLMAEEYYSSEQGNRDIASILSAASGAENVISGINNTLKNVIKSNSNGVLSYSFTHELEKRLKLVGAMIYRVLDRELKDGEKGRILLKGITQVDSIANFYILCMEDEEKKPTELFEYIQKTSDDQENNYYLNTGRDDALEIITLYKLSGTDLLLS